jgi:adenylate kinase
MQHTVALSGTPGTGKTAVAALMSERGWHAIEVGDLARSSGAVVDVDLLVPAMEAHLASLDLPRVLLVGHLAHLMPCHTVVVLRTSPSVLRQRLESRGWPPAKVQENVEAEAVGVVLVESVEREPPVPVYEVDTSGGSPEESARLVAATLEGAGEGMEAGWVDWSEEVMGWY